LAITIYHIYLYVYIYIRCEYNLFGREITICTVIFGVRTRFWPNLNLSFGSGFLHAPSGLHACTLYTHTTHTHTRTHTRTQHTHTHKCAYIQMHTHIHTHNTHTHTHTHTHTQHTTHTHAHTRTQPEVLRTAADQQGVHLGPNMEGVLSPANERLYLQVPLAHKQPHEAQGDAF